ncbi:MAG TPA: hypothetical protein VHB21_06750 [Minicystis sp.]|nr:hypothetical protein [Minicystis sp.]
MSDARQHDDVLDWPARGLSARSREVAFAAAEAILADEDEHGALVPGPRAMCELGVDALDHSVGRSSADLRRGYAVLTLALEWLPLFFIGAFSRMTRLSLERRVAYLTRLEESKIGLFAMLFVAIKVPLCIPAYEDPDALAETGFDRPSLTSRRRLAVVGAPAAEEAAG